MNLQNPRRPDFVEVVIFIQFYSVFVTYAVQVRDLFPFVKGALGTAVTRHVLGIPGTK